MVVMKIERCATCKWFRVIAEWLHRTLHGRFLMLAFGTYEWLWSRLSRCCNRLWLALLTFFATLLPSTIQFWNSQFSCLSEFRSFEVSVHVDDGIAIVVTCLLIRPGLNLVTEGFKTFEVVVDVEPLHCI